jgi:hypothetical protein
MFPEEVWELQDLGSIEKKISKVISLCMEDRMMNTKLTTKKGYLIFIYMKEIGVFEPDKGWSQVFAAAGTILYLGQLFVFDKICPLLFSGQIECAIYSAIDSTIR